MNTEVEVSDLDILAAAQERALAILSDARREAASQRGTGRNKAEELLLHQTEVAERLLAGQRAEARKTVEESQRTAAVAPVERGKAILTDAADQARELLERQAAAAEALRVAEQDEALKTHDAVERSSVAVMMHAHREAAAVLLQARMVVEERQNARRDPR